MATLGDMTPNLAHGNVVSLASVRARRSGDDLPERQPRTVILQASNVQADLEVHRHIGINDALHLADLHEVIDISFSPHPTDPLQTSPWCFTAGEERLDSAEEINVHLRDPHDEIFYHWGLWVIRLHMVDSYPRDRGTPRALCVGGSGSFGAAEFDLAAVNAALTGTDTIRDVLSSTRVEIRDLIRRSEIFDFVPLLQALDLSRPSELSQSARELCASLPDEDELVGHDAFWTVVLALACMSDEHLAAKVLEATMAELGWVNDDGTPMNGKEVRAQCTASLVKLAEIGGYGADALAPVDRLEIYRELLRAQV